MKLLVSVRSAQEADAAQSGGADIIDAKEPTRGSLGPVTAPVLAEILARISQHCAASVALGDLVSPDEVEAAVTSLVLPNRMTPLYLKVGFAGVSSAASVEMLIATAIAACTRRPAPPLLIAVAYADAARARTIPPDTIARLAARAGAAGTLLDTHTKDGCGLLKWLNPVTLAEWVRNARQMGLITALAGGLGLADVNQILGAGPDILGVRGAACEGGREGRVTPGRVRALRQAVAKGLFGVCSGV